jgi:hypothetical protein
MKQETLEEAMMKDGYWESDYDKIWRDGVQFGAKWQEERMYSEEQFEKIAKELFFTMANCDKNIIHKESDFEKWFEQHKNK